MATAGATGSAAGQGPLTVLEIIQLSAAYLVRKGVDSARLDAELLLADLIGLSRVELYTGFDRPIDQAERDAYRERIRRRGLREPVAYITGKREFYSRSFKVGAGVLTPRPETEHLVEHALRLLPPRGEVEGELLDLGCGSGVVGLTLGLERDDLDLVLSDRSAEALHMARENAQALALTQEVRFVQADLLAGLPGPFAMIVMNPPYIASAVLDELAPELGFEPRAALDGGPDGLDIIRRLVLEAPPALNAGGYLLFEIGYDQGVAARSLLEEGGFGAVQIEKDLAGHNRVAMGRKK